MALSDLYQLVHKQHYIDIEMENVYFYEKSDPDLTAVDLGDAFAATIVPLVKAVQGDEVLHNELVIINLGNLADNATELLSGAGTFGDLEMLPAFNAVNFTLKPVSRAVRPGSKRITGIPESVTSFGAITDSAYITALNNLRAALGDPIDNGGEIFYPVVIKRVKTLVPDTEPPKYTYTLPAIGDTPVYARLAACLLNTRVSSQVSRKT